METNQITKAAAATLRKELANGGRASAEAWMKQCILLQKVYYSGCGEELKPLYQLWGFEDWHDYVELELGMHVGTASRDVGIGHFFAVKMGKAWKGQVLSRQRMRAIARPGAGVTESNLAEWMRKALNMTVCGLELALGQKGGHGRVQRSFSFSTTDGRVVEKGLDALMDTGEFENRGQALASLFRAKKAKKVA